MERDISLKPYRDILFLYMLPICQKVIMARSAVMIIMDRNAGKTQECRQRTEYDISKRFLTRERLQAAGVIAVNEREAVGSEAPEKAVVFAAKTCHG